MKRLTELFKFPLKVEHFIEDDVNIVESDGAVVFKCTWMNEPGHIARQKERAEAVIEALDYRRLSVPSGMGADTFCSVEGDFTKPEEAKAAPPDLGDGNGSEFGLIDRLMGKELSFYERSKLKKVGLLLKRMSKKHLK